MNPVLIGYFPRRPRPRAEDFRAKALPPQIEEFCNAGHMNDGAPPNWTELWLHNGMWLYSTELQAWGAAVDTENLRRIYNEESRRWDGIPGSVQKLLQEYVERHVPSLASSFSPKEPRFNWLVYAYRMYPVRFVNGTEEPFEIPEDEIQPVEPLPHGYVSLGLDLVNRTCGNMFECSPLNCNGHYDKVPVNRCCLVDRIDLAFDLARHWSTGTYRADRSYVGPAEPGPYFIVEVLRKNCPLREP